jgi:signal peptidase I
MENSPATKKGSFIKEVLMYAVIALVVVVPIRLWIAQPFVVSGDSMDDTFENGQYLIINELSYEIGKPSRGDVMIFKYPLDPKEYFIKRVIGLPGETVVIHNNTVTIKNTAHPEGFLLSEPFAKGQTFGEETVTLTDSQYFVMGDNRMVSSDSRLWGPVPGSDIVGTPLLRLLPLNTIGADPGDVHFSQ